MCSNSADKQIPFRECLNLVSAGINFDVGRCQKLILFDLFSKMLCHNFCDCVANVTFNKEQNATNQKYLRHPVQKLRLNQYISCFDDLDL